MFFLIRAAFWICVVLLVMPETDAATSKPAEPLKVTAAKPAAAKPSSKARETPAASEIASAGAKLAAACLRKPELCRNGADTAEGFGERLSKGIAVLSHLFADSAAAPDSTGSIARKASRSSPTREMTLGAVPAAP
jgi:hypothetical protein